MLYHSRFFRRSAVVVVSLLMVHGRVEAQT